jgi:quinohemoprotein ethanol dehydrogenase
MGAASHLRAEGRNVTRTRNRRLMFVALAVGLTLVLVSTAIGQAQNGPNVTQPVGSDWPVVGGNLGNGRYSSLDQINTGNVQNLKAAWMIHLGSGLSTGTPPYTLEATPIVQDGVMYMTTGADDVYALDPKTGAEIWEYRSGLDQAINTACCGWDNRGVAVANGLVYVGRLDGAFMALDAKTGRVEWQTQVGRWQDGYTITSAPAYYNGVVYTGISGGEYGVRGKLTALDAATGQELWHFWTVPGPGDFGGDTWPSNDPDPVKADAYLHGGATIWQQPAIDPDLGLIYFSTGNAGPDYDGSVRPGDNLFSVSMVALHLDGSYAWHFQQVHHDIWDFDSPSPTVLYDTTVNGQPVKAIAEASKTGWVYMLDRTNGKPIVGMEEKPVPVEPSQASAPTQPFPVGDALIPQCAEQLANWISACIYDSYGRDFPKLFAPKNGGGVDFAPMSFDPQTNALYAAAWVSPNAGIQGQADFVNGKSYGGGGVSPPIIGAHKYGTLTAMDARTNKIMWQVKNDYTTGHGSGFLTTAGGVAFHGNSDGNFQAYDARTGDLLWQWQTGAGADAPAMTYQIDGQQYVTIAVGGVTANGVGSQRSDMLWTFALNGQSKLQPMPAPTQLPVIVTGFTGPITSGSTLTPPNKVVVADFGYTPNRIQIKAGDTVTFANNGPTQHTATSSDGNGWDTGLLDSGASASFTFDQPGTYYYVCTPHPFMVGQVLVADANGNVPDAGAAQEPGTVHP